MKASQVLPNLFVGSWRDGRDARASDPDTSVICVANDTIEPGPLHFSITDPGTGERDVELFRAAVNCVADCMGRTPRVLVHCQSGVNRSPSVVVAYLMLRHNLSMVPAFNIVKAARPRIDPCDRQLQIAAHVATGAPFDTGAIDRTGFLERPMSDAETAVDSLYLSILGRHADPSGLENYSKRPIDSVRAALNASDEARNLSPDRRARAERYRAKVTA